MKNEKVKNPFCHPFVTVCHICQFLFRGGMYFVVGKGWL